MRWSGTSGFGYAVFTLLLWRVLWGFSGGRWARFASFPLRPSALVRQLRGARRAGDTFDVGHSPSGALSVFALLAALSAQVAAGLLSWRRDRQIGGPLNRFVCEAAASRALWFHKAVGQWLVIGLVLLHVVGRAVLPAGAAPRPRAPDVAWRQAAARTRRSPPPTTPRCAGAPSR